MAREYLDVVIIKSHGVYSQLAEIDKQGEIFLKDIVKEKTCMFYIFIEISIGC